MESLGTSYRIISFSELLQEKYSIEEWENEEGFSFIPHPRIFLWSFPSSGNTWTRYALEYLTKRPSTGRFHYYLYYTVPFFVNRPKKRIWFLALNTPFGIQYPDMNVDMYKSPILKEHEPWSVCQHRGDKPLIRSVDKVIFLIRDYKELYFRRGYKKYYISVQFILKEYFNLLHYFDLWPKDQKILIYYEDLIVDPRNTFSRILEFLKEKPQYLDSFIDHIEFHKERCLSLYNIPNHCKSKGEPNFSYTKNVSLTDLIALEQEIKKHYPILFNRYLKRYELP